MLSQSLYGFIQLTSSTTTEEVIKRIREHQKVFGNPRRFISVRGTTFTSEEFEDYCKSEGIQHCKITTGLPRGNGQVERVNSVVEGVFRRLDAESPGKWHKKVNRVQKAINGSYQRAIGKSPFDFMFGVKMRTPEDVDLMELLENEIYERFQDDRRQVREEARQQIQKIKEENHRSFNENRIPAMEYRVGDVVTIVRIQWGPGLKLAIRSFGPYRITKVKENDRYDVEKVGDGDGPIHTNTEAEDITPWRGHVDDLDSFYDLDDLGDGAIEED